MSDIPNEVHAAIIKAASDWAIKLASIPPAGGFEVNEMARELPRFFDTSYTELVGYLGYSLDE